MTTTPIAPDLEAASAQEVLEHAVEQFHPRLYVACSFQKEASVIMDMLVRIEPSARFFTLDTGFLFPETEATWRALEDRYDVKVERAAGISVDEQARRHGDELWRRDPDACCGIRKVTPLRERLATVDGWVAGLRRDQSQSRAATPKLHWDSKHGLWKVNPLADWTDRDVWNYILENDVPYNELHDKGYASIGCTHCTKPSAGRDGRWADSDKLECGLHG
ncbi:MAG: phosphoadenosine phosphosulfate reductase [Thermoleophilales bacterium]|nr:phosphoadenosine phosphosulfate reductase [Thermoleophilales bacterium]